MKNEEFYYKGCDGKLIHSFCWKASGGASAVLQLSHGMAEHAARYAGFAEWLNGRGYTVYANDHRGHGRTAGFPDEIGFVGEDGFDRTVGDVYLLTCHIKEMHPGLPVFLLGHSFGSFVAQDFITRYGGMLSGVILSGSAMQDGPDVRAALALAYVMKFIGEKRRNNVLDNLMFGQFNRRVENPVCKFDWLSRDGREVAKYDADPMCGGVFTTNFFYQFMLGLTGLYQRDKISRIPVDLPICIMSGGDDPVGGYGKSVEKLNGFYKGLGVRDLTLKLFEGGRHEMLNEINRGEAYEFIASWLDSHLHK